MGHLAEACAVIRRLWTENEPFDFDGTYIHLTGALANPKPVQAPHPPIMIGGRSAAVLRIVAEHADLWNIPGGDIDDVIGRSSGRAMRRDRPRPRVDHPFHPPVSRLRQPGCHPRCDRSRCRRRFRTCRTGAGLALSGRCGAVGCRGAHRGIHVGTTPRRPIDPAAAFSGVPHFCVQLRGLTASHFS